MDLEIVLIAELEPNRRTGTQPAGWVGLNFSTGRSGPVFYRLNTQKKMAFFGDFQCKFDGDNAFQIWRNTFSHETMSFFLISYY